MLMSRFKRRLLSAFTAICFTMALSPHTIAAPAEMVEVSGTLTEPSTYCTLTVLRPTSNAQSPADLTQEYFLTDVFYTRQGQTVENDYTFTISFSSDDEMGWYRYFVVSQTNELITDKFYFAPFSFQETVLQEFNEATAETILDLLHTYTTEYPVLSIDLSNLEEESAQDMAEQLILYRDKQETGKFSDLDDIAYAYDVSFFTIKINHVSAEDLTAFINSIADLFDPAVIEDYNLAADAANANFIKLREDAGMYVTREAAVADIERAICLAVINECSREKIIEAIEQYNHILQLDLDGYYKEADKSELSKALYHQNFQDIDAIKSAFEEKLEEMEHPTKKPGNGNHSGGSSGGGYRGGSSGGSFTTDQTTPPTTPIADPDIPPAAFVDIDEVPWAKDSINALKSRNIVSGDDAGYFRPFDYITREEFTKMIVSAFGLLDKNAECNFADTATGQWHYPYIASAVQAGIVNGITSDRFGTGEDIIRQDIAVLLYRVIDQSGYTLPASVPKAEFIDDSQIAEYAKDAVYALQMANVVSGMGDRSFAAAQKATRAEAAKMLYNALTATGYIQNR